MPVVMWLDTKGLLCVDSRGYGFHIFTLEVQLLGRLSLNYSNVKFCSNVVCLILTFSVFLMEGVWSATQ